MVINTLARVAIITVFSLTLPFVAQPVRAQAGRAITIIPPKYELFSNPGDTLVENIRVKNEADTPVTYTIVIDDFTTSGEEGQVVIEGENETETFSLASWIETETQDVILQPQEEKSLTFIINIPRDAEPGGHYASILFQAGGNDVPGSATVSQRVGSLVLLRVSGNVVEDANIESFTVPNYSKSGPIDFMLRVKNNGNVHMRPEGTIIVENVFGKKVAELPLDSRNVLPGAIRKMDTTWDKENLFGRYTANLVASYGQGSQKKVLTSATTFTVASPIAIILIIVGVIAFFGLIIAFFAGRKRFGKAMKMMATGK